MKTILKIPLNVTVMPNVINSEFNSCHWKPSAECHRNLHLRKAAVEGNTSTLGVPTSTNRKTAGEFQSFFQGDRIKHTHAVIKTRLISYVD